jgi:hypothetical protein
VNGWPELVSVALLGTERREPPALDEPAELRELAADGSAEERLLSTAGAVAVYRRAGLRARSAPSLPAPAPEETLTGCGPAAAGRLTPLLDERRTQLPEWLRALASRDLLAPPERLPDLLEIATSNPPLRNAVESVLGERGRWLAAQEPRWAWAALLSPEEEERERVWATGERLQRRRLFTLLRRAQPARARELLEQSWSQEEPEDRAWLVDALAEGLSPEDEPLLERALDDRRQEGRSAAARMLARLPASAFAQRMRERTVPLVHVAGGIRKRLEVALPEELDDATARDGVARRPPRGVGERAWWLLQLVASTPLSAWEEVGLSPEQAAKLRANDELELPVRQGFARAAEAQRNPAWAAAFIEIEPRLVELADAEQAARVALDRLREGELDVAERLPAPWPRVLSEGALDLLVKLVRRGDDWQRPRLIAERLDPALADEADRQLSGFDPGSAQARQAEEILTVLSFRREMYEELR